MTSLPPPAPPSSWPCPSATPFAPLFAAFHTGSSSQNAVPPSVPQPTPFAAVAPEKQKNVLDKTS